MNRFTTAFWLFVFCLLAPSAMAFDHRHARLDRVVSQHVEGKEVDYAGLKKNPGELVAYLNEVAKVRRSEFDRWSEDQELAFLINVYNAATLKLVIDHYPVKSIKQIGGFKGPWKQEFVRLFGKTHSLDQIEHEMIRKNYDEPRAHFAINCASVGCPSLRDEAYQASKLDAQLRQQGQIFLNDQSKNRVDAKRGRLYLSPIFDWFREDFIGKAGSLESFVAPFFPESQRSAVLSGELDLRFTDYSWKLNRQ